MAADDQTPDTPRYIITGGGTPSAEQLLSLHTPAERIGPSSHIDQNGHMNIAHYFSEGSLGLWGLMTDEVTGPDYIDRRGLSFFTVEHNIRYTGELREGRRYRVQAGLVARTAKAVHGVSLVVDAEPGTVACTMEIVYVHVDMGERRSVAMPGDVAARVDEQVAAHPWLAEVATGLSLRR